MPDYQPLKLMLNVEKSKIWFPLIEKLKFLKFKLTVIGWEKSTLVKKQLCWTEINKAILLSFL